VLLGSSVGLSLHATSDVAQRVAIRRNSLSKILISMFFIVVYFANITFLSPKSKYSWLCDEKSGRGSDYLQFIRIFANRRSSFYLIFK
jgi:hypothetical protein